MFHVKLSLFLLLLCSLSSANRWYRMFNSNHDDPCVDRHKRFQRCIPDFINAAYQKPIYVSSACSSAPKDFCSLSPSSSSSNANQLTDYLTDMNNPNNLTCWQSDPIKAGGNISLVLSLKKKFELTYISLQFCSATKPDSMAIYKSMDMVSVPTAELIIGIRVLARRVQHGYHCSSIRIAAKKHSINLLRDLSRVPMNRKLYASIRNHNYRPLATRVLHSVHLKVVHPRTNSIRVLSYKIG